MEPTLIMVSFYSGAYMIRRRPKFRKRKVFWNVSFQSKSKRRKTDKNYQSRQYESGSDIFYLDYTFI